MAHDNAQRFRFLVLRRCILPKADGGSETLFEGREVSGPHYEQFVRLGVLRPVVAPPEPLPSAGTNRCEHGATPLEAPQQHTPQVEPAVQELAPASPKHPVFTKEGLDALTKRQVQALAPDAKGSKGEIIKIILARQEV